MRRQTKVVFDNLFNEEVEEDKEDQDILFEVSVDVMMKQTIYDMMRHFQNINININKHSTLTVNVCECYDEQTMAQTNNGYSFCSFTRYGKHWR